MITFNIRSIDLNLNGTDAAEAEPGLRPRWGVLWFQSFYSHIQVSAPLGVRSSHF